MFVLVFRKSNQEVLFYMGKFHGMPCFSQKREDAKLYKSYNKAYDAFVKVSGQQFEQCIGWSIFQF